MRDGIIHMICVAVLGGVALVATYSIVKHQQVVAMQSIDKVTYANAINDIARRELVNTSTRYKYAIIAGAVGALVGIGVGVVISGRAGGKGKPRLAAPGSA